jgi:CBS-domain-containing membrane protein
MTGKVDIVLDRERRAEKRLPRRTRVFEVFRYRQEFVAREKMDPDFVVASARDAVEHAGHNLRRREAAVSVACGEGGEIKAVMRAKHDVFVPEIRSFDERAEL